jgi:hypothetical protein
MLIFMFYLNSVNILLNVSENSNQVEPNILTLLIVQLNKR